LFFGIGFGMYWSSVDEHVTWRQRDILHLEVVTANEPYAR